MKPTPTECVTGNANAAMARMFVLIGHLENGGEIADKARDDLRILKYWVSEVLDGRVPEPGDSVMEREYG